jgi:hypothetical protein
MKIITYGIFSDRTSHNIKLIRCRAAVWVKALATTRLQGIVWNNIDKKLNKILLMYKEIQNGSGAKSYMTNDFLIYG